MWRAASRWILFEQFERTLDSPILTLKQLAEGVEARLLAHLDGLLVGGLRVYCRKLLVLGRGHRVVTQSAGTTHYDLAFQYKFYDRYNWDKTKSTNIPMPGPLAYTAQHAGFPPGDGPTVGDPPAFDPCHRRGDGGVLYAGPGYGIR